MVAACTHVDSIAHTEPVADGCVNCLAIGDRWLHLRRCDACGYIGCCDSSPNRHATAHYRQDAHPLIQSFEPGEEWYWRYVDEVGFELPDEGRSPAHG